MQSLRPEFPIPDQLYPSLSSTANRSSQSGADLSAAVDVYSDWVDACDAVASKQSELRADGEADRPQARPSAGRGGARRAESDDVDDGANYVADDFVEVDDAGDDDDY